MYLPLFKFFNFLFRRGWFVGRVFRYTKLVHGSVLSSAPPRRNFYRHKVTRVIECDHGSASTMRNRKLIIRPTCNSLLQWPRYNEIFSPTFKPVVDLSLSIYIIRTYRLIYSRASSLPRETRSRIYVFGRLDRVYIFSTIAKHVMTNIRS